MPREAYINADFRPATRALLSDCNRVIQSYQAQGFRLTLRQLFYQLVTRNIIANLERAYKNLGSVLSRGRLAGLVDWEAIEDRLRAPDHIAEWESPGAMMDAVVQQYTLPRWASQPKHVELWCEKDALAGVLRPITRQYHVTLMVNRGYSSQSAMKESAQRLEIAAAQGKTVSIFYIGDQDPSGEDMVRDVGDRLRLLTREAFEIEVVKLAITEAQVAQYNPPPNPAKLSDSRAAGYIAKFGAFSYEADALPPEVLAGLVRGAIEGSISSDQWEGVVEREEQDKALLRDAAQWIMEQRNGDATEDQEDQEGQED